MNFHFSNFTFSSILNSDIDIDSEDYEVTDNCESQNKPDIEKTIGSEAEKLAESAQTSNIQTYGEIYAKEKSSPEMQENNSTQEEAISESLKAKLYIDKGKICLFSSIA